MFVHLFILPVFYITVLHVNCWDYIEDTNLRVVGGTNATDRADFFYQASLRVRKKHNCGGTIISEKAVLTAAHCCYNYVNKTHGKKFSIKILTVVVGTLQLNETSDLLLVEKVIMHPKYNKIALVNDLAIWKVKTKIEFSNYVQKIVLATIDPTLGTLCRVSGWGRTKDNASFPMSNNLVYTDVTIQDKLQCRMLHMRINIVSRSMICASELKKEDFCEGDDGGPLVCNDELAGIASFGYKCGGYMGVYSSVAFYSRWIEKNGCLHRFHGYQFSLLNFLFILCFIL